MAMSAWGAPTGLERTAEQLYEGVSTREGLAAADIAIDRLIAGAPLDPGELRAPCAPGAHAPTPTPYFIARDLCAKMDLDGSSHVLDVGCGMGRMLACHAAMRLPGRVTGVELDAELAARAAAWTRAHDGLAVVSGSALDMPLSSYTHFYLFNPFDSAVLARFLDTLEREAGASVLLVHMSDNGENYAYLGRPGWKLREEGFFHEFCEGRRRSFEVYGCPQHYSIWKLERAR